MVDTKEVSDLKKDVAALHGALNKVLAMVIQQRGLEDFDSSEYLTIVEGLSALARHRDLPTRILLIEKIDKLVENGTIK